MRPFFNDIIGKQINLKSASLFFSVKETKEKATKKSLQIQKAKVGNLSKVFLLSSI
ncbi:hypothetical protein DB44_EH00040 [Candidatus Protochlamydia amoebophila]|uniref:Uncharacterized protein n=1 Tax=Candidatus Protochlamydia amoebophila TaxID=362787 RepID=A0A0C1JVB1_9BACT|nr:hypothetical protein DB44_EH00040 [Candidatus Protochlamydia amoebophila]